MQTVTRNYFECKIKHSQVQENGTEGNVSEIYVVDALSYTEAETKITYEMQQQYAEFEIDYIKPAKYKEIAFMSGPEKVLQGETDKLMRAMQSGQGQEQLDQPIDWNPSHTDTLFYRCVLEFITLDEKSGKEKRSKYTMLVEGTSLHSAVENLEKTMEGTMVDYDSVNICKTKVADILLYKE